MTKSVCPVLFFTGKLSRPMTSSLSFGFDLSTFFGSFSRDFKYRTSSSFDKSSNFFSPRVAGFLDFCFFGVLLESIAFLIEMDVSPFLAGPKTNFSDLNETQPVIKGRTSRSKIFFDWLKKCFNKLAPQGRGF